MTASPDDAAASDVPLRAGVGPAAPSFPGTPGRRSPEDSPMPQHTPAPDETVRMRPDGADGRPPLNGNLHARREEADETRPVPRDWLSGAPGATPATPTTVPSPAFEDGTDRMDLPALDSAHPVDVGDGPVDDHPPADDDTTSGPRRPWWRRRAVLVPAGAVAVLAAAYGIDLAVSQGSIPRS